MKSEEQRRNLGEIAGQAAELAQSINAPGADAAIDQGRAFVEDVVRLLMEKGRIGSADQAALRAWLLREIMDLNTDKRALGAMLDDDIRAGALVELARDVLRTI